MEIKDGMLIASDYISDYTVNVTNKELFATLIGKVKAELLFNKYNLKDIVNLTQMQLNEVVGKNAANKIYCCLEIAKRKELIKAEEVESIKSSADAANYFRPILRHLAHEEFWILLLNRANKPQAIYKIGQGGVSQTLVDARLILKQAILNLSSSIVLCHNHPSGSILPSMQDINLTCKIIDAAKTFDIKVLDHIIIAKNDYYSFADNDRL